MKLRVIRKTIRKVLEQQGYTLVPKAALPPAVPPDFQTDEIDIIKAVRPYTMTSQERLYSLIQAVRYVVKAGIPGDLVECGVWRGGSMMAMAYTLLQLGITSRSLYLFDTFAGMPPAADVDRDYRGRDASTLLSTEDPASSRVWAIASLPEVRQNLAATGYPHERLFYVQGDVTETIPEQAPPQIALLRLDTDWYESTRHELEHLYPRLAPGGILIIDDYGHWEGARRAVDEYLAQLDVPLFLSRVDYTGRIAVKPHQ